MDEGKPLDQTIRLAEVNGAPISERGDRQVRQRRQDLLGFWRGREGGAQARKEYSLLTVALVLGLRAHPLGNVARNLRCSDNRPALVPDRGDAQRDVNERAVFPAPNGLEMIDRFAHANARKHLVFLVLPVFRNDRADRSPNHLRRRVSKHPLRRGVPRRDNTAKILADDGVVGRVDDTGQQRVKACWRIGHEANLNRTCAAELCAYERSRVSDSKRATSSKYREASAALDGFV